MQPTSRIESSSRLPLRAAFCLEAVMFGVVQSWRFLNFLAGKFFAGGNFWAAETFLVDAARFLELQPQSSIPCPRHIGKWVKFQRSRGGS
jgi:hypothetical protein